jgi:Xaa-Pro aminopeptidase
MTHRARLADYLASNDLEAVWFARPASFAWVVGGDNVVDRAGDVGVAAAGYDGDSVTVVTNNIEAPRLRDEELPANVQIETFDWHDSSLPEAVAAHSPEPAAADFEIPGFESVDTAAIRQPLTEADVENYRTLGTEAAEIVERVARDVTAQTTEREVAADLRREFAVRGIESPVVLVGGSKRAQQYRHYTPQDEPLGQYALVSVTVSRGGLFASLTRTVAFDAPDWLGDRTQAAMEVEASALAATQEVGQAGGTAGDVFEAIQDAYAAVGHPDEWREHHQGGAAGFAGREWIATPDADDEVHLPMAYAWNPTVQGAKSEDTVLVTEDGFEVLTSTGDWPTETVTSHDGNVELERHAVLD